MKGDNFFFLVMVFCLLLALIFSMITFVERVKVEGSNPVVELVLDYESFLKLVRTYNIEPGPVLQELSSLGLTSLAIPEQDLTDLVKENLLIWTTQDRLRELYYLTGIHFPHLGEGDDFFAGLGDGTFIFTPSFQVASFLMDSLTLREERGVQIIRQQEYSYLFYVDRPSSNLKDLPLGYVDDLTSYFQYGLRPLPRIKNQDLEDEGLLRKIWEDVYYLPSTIIFSGGEVFGYEDSLHVTTSLIEEGGHLLGVIEPFIAKQKGVMTLAQNLDSRITRVHSIQHEEMMILSESRVLARYLRAVRERNVRTLYIRLFHEEDPVEVNLTFMKNLVTMLKESGYLVGPAQPFSSFSTSPYRLFIINLGVFAGLIFFLRIFTKRKILLFCIFLLCILFSLLTLFKGMITFNQQVLGLLTTIIFPTWGILLILKKLIGEGEEIDFLGFLSVGFKTLAFTTLFSLLGGLLLVGIFQDLSYLLQITVFRGIKIAFILPLLLIALGFFYLNRGIPWTRDDILQLLHQPICFKHLFGGGVLLLAAFIYLGRTGNFPLIPVPNLEILFRDYLEQVMVFRPRFKEFLVGHPFFLLAVFFSKNKKILPFLLILGSIGQLSIINSFAHLHTPLLVSLWRTFSSLLLGSLLGLILPFLFSLQAFSLKKGRDLS